MAKLPNEDDLVVIIWANLSEKSVSRGRPYETMTREESSNPIAWRLSYIKEKYPRIHNLTVLTSADDVMEHLTLPRIVKYSKLNPVLLPVSLAKSVLGWQHFDVWDGDRFV